MNISVVDIVEPKDIDLEETRKLVPGISLVPVVIQVHVVKKENVVIKEVTVNFEVTGNVRDARKVEVKNIDFEVEKIYLLVNEKVGINSIKEEIKYSSIFLDVGFFSAPGGSGKFYKNKKKTEKKQKQYLKI